MQYPNAEEGDQQLSDDAHGNVLGQNRLHQRKRNEERGGNGQVSDFAALEQVGQRPGSPTPPMSPMRLDIMIMAVVAKGMPAR